MVVAVAPVSTTRKRIRSTIMVEAVALEEAEVLVEALAKELGVVAVQELVEGEEELVVEVVLEEE